MMKKTIFIIVLFLSVWTYKSKAQEFKITIDIKGIKDSTIYLGFYYADKQQIAATAIVNSKNIAVFEGEEKLPEGLYFIALPGPRIFDLIINNDQEFKIKSDTAQLLENIKVTGSKENEVFFEYQNFMKSQFTKIDELYKNLEKAQTKKDSLDIQDKINRLELKSKDYWKQKADENPNTFFANLLKGFNDTNTTNFDNIVFEDERLLFSPLIYKSLQRLLARNVNNIKPYPIIIQDIDNYVEKASVNDEIFKYSVSYLLQFFYNYQKPWLNEVFAHIAEKYYFSGKANWLDSAGLASLKEMTKKLSAAFVGKSAPDIKLEGVNEEYFSLLQTEGDYTFLFFYSPGCGHCQKAAKKLVEFLDSDFATKTNSKVFAVFTKQNKTEWEKFIKENKTQKFINVYDPLNDNTYKINYYVVSTPLLYVLDKNKKIIDRLSGDEPIIRMLEKHTNE